MHRQMISSFSRCSRYRLDKLVNHRQGLSTSSTLAQGAEYTDEDHTIRSGMRVPHRNEYDLSSCENRRQWVEEFTGEKLKKIKGFWNDDTCPSVTKGNTENVIGLATIPLGIAGPLRFVGTHARGPFLLPLATTEGTLVASMTRGARCLTESGGVETYAYHQQTHRMPAFILEDAKGAHEFGQWAVTLKDQLQNEVVSQRSRRAKILTLTPIYDDKCVLINFAYDTGDAAGQNMVMDCTWACLEWILEKVKEERPACDIQRIYVDTLLSGDKHPNAFTNSIGRGHSVSARCIIPGDIMRHVLNVAPRDFVDYVHWAHRSMMRGNLDFNVSVCNTLAGVYAATGQDIACVGEGSSGGVETAVYLPDKDAVEYSLHLPNLTIGTVGGGTQLPTQKECLQIMGCDGTGKSKKLAELIAGFCLALDLSTTSAAVTGEIVGAHNRLGRNRPT